MTCAAGGGGHRRKKPNVIYSELLWAEYQVSNKLFTRQ